ncbi:MAG: hypothetical protein IT243_05275 [Bacteroidia bacterium]|nr:hypothetical protein [Bacteroidia bacterium]
MKKFNLFLFTLLSITLFASCNEDLFDIKFGLNAKEVTYKINPTTQAGDIILEPMIQSLNLDSLAQANGTTLDKVKNVFIRKITATILNPPGKNFEIINSGYIETGIQGDPDFDLLRLAEIITPPGPVTEFDITPTNADILKYAKRPQINFSGKLVTNGPLTDTTTLKLKVEFEVVANPL